MGVKAKHGVDAAAAITAASAIRPKGDMGRLLQ
jgi:hypothetical protein